jgi:hypothetical protein
VDDLRRAKPGCGGKRLLSKHEQLFEPVAGREYSEVVMHRPEERDL